MSGRTAETAALAQTPPRSTNSDTCWNESPALATGLLDEHSRWTDGRYLRFV